MKKVARVIAIMLFAILATSCNLQKEDANMSSCSQCLLAKSDTGLDVKMPLNKTSKKQVGIFYFVTGGCSNYGGKNLDNSIILENFTLPVKGGIKLTDWQANGGGGVGTAHFWGQPLFGYYDDADEWVIERHLMMFIEAGIDYIVIDQTNGVLDGYLQRIKALFRVFYKYQQAGYKVPKITFMCNDDGPDTVNTLYVQIYNKYPEWSDLFYHWNDHDKPVIFDNIASYNKKATAMINTEQKLAKYKSGVTDFFEIRDVAFPHETVNSQSNFLEGKSLIYLDARDEQKACVDMSDNGYTYANVAVSVIRGGRCTRQWTGDNTDYTRSWDGTCNRNWNGEPEAYLYGYNFEREFMNAINQDVDNIFITGWNEWVAALSSQANGTIGFMDCGDINNSRDIEPMKGGYGDNYFIQMCKLISLFKYGDTTISGSPSITIDITGSFDQWQNSAIVSYDDPEGDGFERNYSSAGDKSLIYKFESATNDIVEVKIAGDNSNVYFYVQTKDEIQDAQSDGKMTLLISTSGDTCFDFTVNRTIVPGQENGKVLIESLNSDYSVKSEVGLVDARIEGREMMISVPRALLGIGPDTLLGVKWIDTVDITAGWESLYLGGETAPYGRFAFAFR